MRDPYLYENTEVLKNKLDIRTQDGLNDAEADYVVYRLKELAMNPLPGEYNTEHLLRMHHYIFQDLYEILPPEKDPVHFRFVVPCAHMYKPHLVENRLPQFSQPVRSHPA